MGRRGPQPQPNKLKLLRGNPGKRKIPKEPEPTLGIPDRPDFLNDVAIAEWDRVVPELYGLGLLALVDGSSLAAYCQSYARYVEAEEFLNVNGSTYETVRKDGSLHYAKFPQVEISRQSAQAMHRFAAAFGLNPSSRSGLAVKLQEDQSDAFTEFETG